VAATPLVRSVVRCSFGPKMGAAGKQRLDGDGAVERRGIADKKGRLNRVCVFHMICVVSSLYRRGPVRPPPTAGDAGLGRRTQIVSSPESIRISGVAATSPGSR